MVGVPQLQTLELLCLLVQRYDFALFQVIALIDIFSFLQNAFAILAKLEVYIFLKSKLEVI